MPETGDVVKVQKKPELFLTLNIDKSLKEFLIQPRTTYSIKIILTQRVIRILRKPYALLADAVYG
jgi:hypothetical protein